MPFGPMSFLAMIKEQEITDPVILAFKVTRFIIIPISSSFHHICAPDDWKGQIRCPHYGQRIVFEMQRVI